MAGTVKVVHGPWQLFVAAEDTVFAPGAFPETPTGFTALASNLMADASVTVTATPTTRETQVLDSALPVDESVASQRITITGTAQDWSAAAWERILGKTKSTVGAKSGAKGYDKVELDMNIGSLPKAAYVLVSQNGPSGKGKQFAMYLPSATAKPSGSVGLSSAAAGIPFVLNAIKTNIKPAAYIET